MEEKKLKPICPKCENVFGVVRLDFLKGKPKWLCLSCKTEFTYGDEANWKAV